MLSRREVVAFLGAVDAGFTRRYRYATDGNRLVSSSAPGESSEPFSHSYSYDAHGNMMAMPHLAAMDWDHADRLQHCDLGGGGDVWFVYDASGTRVRKVRVNTSGSSVRERIYLGDYELYRERAANSALPSSERQTLHVADDTGRICLVETRTVAEGDPVITPVSMPRYQHGNHLGSAALELDANAAVISYEEFHPFGTTSYAANDSGIEVSAKRYRYIGKERDEETGLYHLGARYYAAWLARWTASDPIGLADGVNRYAYVAGNPIGARDTTGTAGTTFQPGDVLSREQIAEYQKNRSVAGNTFPVLLPGGDQYYAVPNSAVRIAPGMPGTDAGHLAWSWHGTAGVAWEGRYHETAERLAAAQNLLQRARLRELTRAFSEGRDQSKATAGEIEFLLDEEFPDDDEMQDYVSDLSRFAPGGGEHLHDENQIAKVCRDILRRLEAAEDGR